MSTPVENLPIQTVIKMKSGSSLKIVITKKEITGLRKILLDAW